MKKAFTWLWLIAALILLAACGSQTDVVTDAGQTETTPAEELPPRQHQTVFMHRVHGQSFAAISSL